jgi:hypothetical protein
MNTHPNISAFATNKITGPGSLNTTVLCLIYLISQRPSVELYSFSNIYSLGGSFLSGVG